MATILLADDDELFCFLLHGVLSSHGHEVLTAYHGREALKLFRQHHPQITVLDLRMPEMDGLEVLRQIRASDPQAVVMVLTAGGIDDPWNSVPQMTAPEFFHALRQLRYPGGLILLSERVEHALEAQACNLDTIDLLRKPVTPERLLVAVQIGMATLGKPPIQGRC